MASTVNQNNFSIFKSPEVCVVEASAGSGKTFALAKRYVQLLLVSPGSNHTSVLKTILAITFTNKAAAEMKTRILEFLKKIALNNLSPMERSQIIGPLGLSESEASARAFVVMEGLIRNYNFFQVQTIDSFTNALLSGCSFKIGLSANFKIKRNSREYLAASLDRLIDRAVDDKEVRRVFLHFLHQYLFIENRSGWFPKKDLLKLMGVLFQKENHFVRNFRSTQQDPKEIFLKKKVILKTMQELKDCLPENTHATFSKNFLGFLKKSPDSFDIDAISTSFERDEFPVTKKGAPASEEVERCWRAIRRELKNLCELEAMSLFDPYIDIFRLTAEELQTLAVGEDVLFLEQLSKKARALFDDGLVTVEELYYRLATRFHHYMIDEFQDTNRLHWEMMSMMVQEALSTGGSFFYVGDKKQAIYSFRGGDSSLFDEIKAHFASFNVREEVLGNNYRSRANIVEFNNRIFAPENLKRFIDIKQEHDFEKNKKDAVFFDDDDRQRIGHVFANARQNARPGFEGGLIRVERLEGEKKEEREQATRRKILDLIADLRGRYSLGDIAILTRNNKDVEEITGWLLEVGIAVASERTSNIQANKTIQEIVAFLKFLDSPIDNLSFADFILGDVFARASGREAAVWSEFVFGLRARISADSSFYIYREFRDRYPELWGRFFEDFFKNVGLYPLYEFVVNLLERLEVHQHCPGDRGFLMHFLEVIKKREKEYGDLAAFLEYFADPLSEDLYVNVAGHDAVTILTVHKAKGLEFPVVILPAFEMEIDVGSGGKDGQQSFIVHHGEDANRLLRLKTIYRHYSPELNKLYEYEYKKDFFSELNNIYVALTRAVHELYIFIPSRAGMSFNVAQFLIPEDSYAIGKSEAPRPWESQERGRLELLPSFSRDWMGFLRDEFTGLAVTRREARRQGEFAHFFLSFIGNLDKANLEECLLLAKAGAQAQSVSIQELGTLEAGLRALVEIPQLRPFFYSGQDEVFCEREIVDAFGETKRIDRMIVRRDSVDVIDFKSSKEESKQHHKQVANYMKLIQQIYPLKKIQGWLIYLDDRSVEQVI